MKDQTICPKCYKMYCEGFWGEGVCTSDMYFGTDPTSAGDQEAYYLRQWYEAHRESWWERRGKRWELWADNLMLGLMNEMARIRAARTMEELERRRNREDDDS